jgi:UDP-glucose 4-epimerase
MKVLVTGGAGYIGSATVATLLAKNHEVLVFDNFKNGHRDAVPEGVKVYQGDLRNEMHILSALISFEPDAIIHFAAYAYVGESMEKPHMYYDNNVRGTMNLMHAIMQADNIPKKIIFSSSCATYGTPAELPITEDMPQRPENPYGQTKLDCENMIKWYTSTIPGMTYTFLRYFNAAGGLPELGLGEQHDPETHLIPLIMDAVIGKREKVYVFGTDYDTPDGSCVRDYIHIQDLADAHVLALDDDKNDFYNLGTGVGYSVLDLIVSVAGVTGVDVPFETKGRRPGDPAALYADNKKALEGLGWKPKHSSLQNIVESAWDWHTECQPFLK